MVRQKKQQDQEAMGKSRGGLSTKIHAAVDALGNPVRFILTAGQYSEIKQANALIQGLTADYVIADKGYDAEYNHKFTKEELDEILDPHKYIGKAVEQTESLIKVLKSKYKI